MLHERLPSRRPRLRQRLRGRQARRRERRRGRAHHHRGDRPRRGTLPQDHPNYVDPNGAVNVESLQKDYDFFDEQGLLESTVTVEDIVDSSFTEAAVAELGEFTG
ncbi:hypothetical protein [Georgenia sp. AZ-5]|uniref:hypothetical protein n=1 Tax=Georgenia sp. AZ-5 TaxID=3367526 RepID=UPI0037544899